MTRPQYSADWGDYISFATHMRRLADKEGFDLLLVDTGDRVEGNGLYDASDPKGKYTFDIFKQQHIDIITSGNHELYKENSSLNEFEKTVPNYKDSYLASNIDIHNPKTGVLQPLAPRYKKITTKNLGIRITAFGFLYDFERNANNTVVRRVQDTVKEKWFQDAIRDHETDLFVVAGHVAAESAEYRMIFNAIRDAQWDVPIQFFAGHTHIRDYKRYDGRATALESGRYMETIGFASIEHLAIGATKGSIRERATPKFRRRYIDNNLFSLRHHALRYEHPFPTELGINVSRQIAEARAAMGLDRRYGCAPKDLWVNRVDVNSPDSIFSWLGGQLLPGQLTGGKKDKQPKLVITNTGSIRFDLFKGPFTRDSQFLISPFDSGFRRIKDVEHGVAQKLLNVLNNNAPILQSLDSKLDPSTLLPPEQLGIKRIANRQPRPGAQRSAQVPFTEEDDLQPGYMTRDDAGDDGDDTAHVPIPFFKVPNCIQSEVDFPDDKVSIETVDLVYNEFIEPWVITALRFIGAEYDEEDTTSYARGKTVTEVISDWVSENWKCRD